VTPLRDGMNLVAKEYVAAQRPEDPGALVLSRFAGAAQELNRAILVNPYDPDEIAEGLHTALTMPLAERQERWRAMNEAVWCSTAVAWSDRFLAKLTKAAVQGGQGRCSP
jgi:trehalose 6-phosphate synthase